MCRICKADCRPLHLLFRYNCIKVGDGVTIGAVMQLILYVLKKLNNTQYLENVTDCNTGFYLSVARICHFLHDLME
jgi:hypothetical protein